MRKGGIYAIRHKASQKVYVGSAMYLRRRIAQHKTALNAGMHRNPKLQAAWNKYGARAFEFIELEYVTDPTLLIGREQAWIDKLRSAESGYGYNIRKVAESNLGLDCSSHIWAAYTPAQRAARGRAISAAKKGVVTEAMRAAQRALVGTKRSAETREKLRQSHMGYLPNDVHRANLGAASKAAWARGTRERFDISEALAAEAEKLGRELTPAEVARVDARERTRRYRARRLALAG